jgi:hypothetical protein
LLPTSIKLLDMATPAFSPASFTSSTTFAIQRLPTKREVKRHTHWTSLVLASKLSRGQVLDKLQDLLSASTPGFSIATCQVYAVTPSIRFGYDPIRDLITDLNYFLPSTIESDRLQAQFESWAWIAFNGYEERYHLVTARLDEFNLSARRQHGKCFVVPKETAK